MESLRSKSLKLLSQMDSTINPDDLPRPLDIMYQEQLIVGKFF